MPAKYEKYLKSNEIATDNIYVYFYYFTFTRIKKIFVKKVDENYFIQKFFLLKLK